MIGATEQLLKFETERALDGYAYLQQTDFEREDKNIESQHNI